jgi:hypothetical protein
MIGRSDTPADFQVLPPIGGEARTFGSIARWRRLVRDDEKRIDVSHAMIPVALGGLAEAQPGGSTSGPNSQRNHKFRFRDDKVISAVCNEITTIVFVL